MLYQLYVASYVEASHSGRAHKAPEVATLIGN